MKLLVFRTFVLLAFAGNICTGRAEEAPSVRVSSCLHHVKSNEYIIDLLKKHSQAFAYDQQLLQMTKSLNPKVKNIEKIYPGQTITLPVLLGLDEESKIFCESKTVVKYTKTSKRQPSSKVKYVEVATVKNSLDFPATSVMALRLGSSYDVLKSAGTGGTKLVSELQPSAHLQWRQRWSSEIETLFGFALGRRTYAQTLDTSKTISQRSAVTTGFDFGMRNNWGALSFIQVTLGQEEFVYFLQASEGNYKVKKDSTLNGKFDLNLGLIERKPLSASFLLHYAHYTSGQQKFSGGSLAGGGFAISHDFGDSQLTGHTLFRSGRFETNTFKFDYSSLDLSILYQFEF